MAKMKNRYVKRSICATLAFVMIASVCGCSNDKQAAANIEITSMEAEEVDSYSFDFIGGTDVMPIGGFYGPFPSTQSVNGDAIPNYITDEIFEMISDCGLNLIVQTITDYNTTPQFVIEMLELGEKYGVGITVNDSGLPHGEGTLSLNETAKRINEYSNYPAFCGSHVVDEPANLYFNYNESRTIDKYANKLNNLSELGVWSYINMNPLYDSTKRNEYNDYLDEALSSMDMKMLLWDNYVHDKRTDAIDMYFYNLSACREKAEEYGIPFWTYIQAGSQWNDSKKYFDSEEPYYPDEGEFMWNVNTCLAYGAKGMVYFPIIQPLHFAYAKSQPYDFERNSLIGVTGNKNRWWYYAQNANEQIAAVDEVLMNAVNKGVIVTGTKAEEDNKSSSFIMEEKSWRELVGITGDTMVGCFNYQGKSAFYVVNYDMEYAQNITLEFHDDCNFAVTQRAETTQYQGDGITLTMAAGEGVLVVME